MLKFRKITPEDFEIYNEFLKGNTLFNCESPFVNLYVWQNVYDNMIAINDGVLYLKSGKDENAVFRLPIGNNMEKGLAEIFDYCKPNKPNFWLCEDEIKEGIPQIIAENYDFNESRDDFDYVYLSENLATLSGKKYHSKRNHISAFSLKYNWVYKKITSENTDDVRLCAQKWYGSRENDSQLKNEKEGIEFLLSNLEKFNIIGGAIYVESKVVAFTLGTALNDDVFVTHVEKALPEFAECYTVINREFAKNELLGFKYINREDDMGIEGVRKAKLSYKPNILLKKYYCTPKNKLENKNIYTETFGTEDSEFTDSLFENCFKYLKSLRKDGKTVSQLFLLPCELKNNCDTVDAHYLFAAVTDISERGKGYMSELIENIKKESRAPIFLRPASIGLIKFYEKLGFKTIKAINSSKGEIQLLPKDEFKMLIPFADKPDNTEYDFMVYGLDFKDKVNFLYSFD